MLAAGIATSSGDRSLVNNIYLQNFDDVVVLFRDQCVGDEGRVP